MQYNLVERDILFVIKKGIPSSTPSPPELVREYNASAEDYEIFELCLAEITVNANTTSVAQSNIRDTRLDSSLCGLVVALIDRIDFTVLFRQYSAQFNEWFEYIQTISTGDMTANILNELERLNAALNKTTMLASGGSSGMTELDDLEICSGCSTANTGTYIEFPHPFTGIPRVAASSGDQTRMIQIYNITKKGFNCTVSSISVTTAAQSAGSSGAELAGNVVTGVSFTTVNTNVDWIAVYDGGI